MSKKRVASKHTSPKRTSRKQAHAVKRVPSWVWAAVTAIAVVAIVVLMIVSRQSPAEAMPNEINITQAYEKYRTGAFLLDVRTPEEWDGVRIPNTTLIPLTELPKRVNEVPSDQEIVVVCRSGNRSQDGRDILLQAGYEQVSSMTGGVNAWRAAGYPIESTTP